MSRKVQKAIDSIRKNMLFFGHDLSNISDEELKTLLIITSKSLCKSGVSAKEALAAIKTLTNGEKL